MCVEGAGSVNLKISLNHTENQNNQVLKLKAFELTYPFVDISALRSIYL